MNPSAKRLLNIEPFHVMDILARARAMEREGRSVIHMEIGEPDFPTAPAIVQAGIVALQTGHTHYTPALGLTELRAAIATNYPEQARPDASRVAVTPGASGALQLIFAALINPGDQVLMADPGYPCNRHFVSLFEGQPVAVPVDATTGYQLNANLVRQHWTKRTVAVLLASPSNPTGTIIPTKELDEIIRTVEARGGVLIVDEIYHGLVYAEEAMTALSYSQNLFVVNSFSKYYGMTGWRLGWLVAPISHMSAIDKLAQNIFLAASTPAQYAALTAFTPEVQRELAKRREIFRERRDYLLPALRELGFEIPLVPQGAFYLYADCSRFTQDSQAFALELLEKTGVAITPGLDFGSHRAAQHVRFSYANTLENLQEGVSRLRNFL
ncbi:MAG: pyridoxal phosphate-dependent aminotransferase [Gammaproteobacteria bacterium]|nr:pyridoxal phosphate-dependent aminotransferase [Gammaproteobacteria bacterium]MDH3562878.1 pyridoxal phosphate-dependent aminotransferase [Gammaproteobacteria bacterium]MDH5487486.1 pyridoxal phosphate-dependent aminotransferase [Gammaproteobacteria bacterium]